MCFSASASFTAAGVLSLLGVMSICLNKNQSYRMLALTPLLFAIQQAAEGIVWLTIYNSTYQLLFHGAVYTFLGFAGILWPLWAPTSLWAIEQNAVRKKILLMLACWGLLVGCQTLWLFLTSSLQTNIIACSLDYRFSNTVLNMPWIETALYSVASVLPFFISSLYHTKFFGTCLLVALALSSIIMYQTAASVWCFSAALLSVIVVWIIIKEQYL